jgi:uncharacterized membrane protein
MRTIRLRFLASVLAVSFFGATCQAFASGGGEPDSVWTYSLYKTITYEILTRTADIPVYYLVTRGAAASGLAFTGVNLATGAVIYYFFEAGWNLYGPTIKDQPVAVALEIETKKTLLYRIVATARKLALGYAFTGSPVASVGFALLSNVVSGAIYAANEYGWYTYGPPLARPRTAPMPPISAPELGTRAFVAAENGVAYLGDLATTARGALAGDLTNAISDLRQRVQ